MVPAGILRPQSESPELNFKKKPDRPENFSPNSLKFSRICFPFLFLRVVVGAGHVGNYMTFGHDGYDMPRRLS